MKEKNKKFYESPETVVLEIKTKSVILTISGGDPEGITWEDDFLII